MITAVAFAISMAALGALWRRMWGGLFGWRETHAGRAGLFAILFTLLTPFWLVLPWQVAVAAVVLFGAMIPWHGGEWSSFASMQKRMGLWTANAAVIVAILGANPWWLLLALAGQGYILAYEAFRAADEHREILAWYVHDDETADVDFRWTEWAEAVGGGAYFGTIALVCILAG